MSEYVTCRLRCPVCATEFAADELHAPVQTGRESDFRPIFEGGDPLLTLVHACPKCRYSNYREGFEQEPGDDDELLEPYADDARALSRPSIDVPSGTDVEDLRRYVKSGELVDGLLRPGEEPFGHVRYRLAARVHEFLWDAESPGAAHLLLRAAWCARSDGALLVEREAQLDVLRRLEPRLDEAELAEHERLRLAYLVAELSRRVGDFGRALDLFAQVERDSGADDDDGLMYAMLARRQALLAQVKSTVNARIPDDWPGRGSAEDDELASLPSGDDDDDDDGGTLN